MSNDRILVEAVLAGQEGGFERLVELYQKLVWQIVMRMTQDVGATEDLCQDVFLRVHLKLKTFRFECSLATWIGRIAFRMALRDQKKRTNQPAQPNYDPSSLLETLSSDSDMEAVLVRSDLTNNVRAAIHSLPPLQQTFMALYYGEDCSVSEIGAICQQPTGTVKSYLYRARNQVRKTLLAKLKESQ